jgi:DUF971 family protein
MTAEAPKSIKAYRDQGVLEVGWNDGAGDGTNQGTVQRIPFKTLRALCPCAGCVDELTGVRTLDVEAIPADIAPTHIELCGNYALRVEWSDGHSTGLYTWQRLAEIGANAAEARQES